MYVVAEGSNVDRLNSKYELWRKPLETKYLSKTITKM